MRAQGMRLPRAGVLQEADKHDGVVGQILADARKIRAHLDAELAQLCGRPNARSQQECGREDAARRQDDLARAESLFLAVDARGNAAYPAAIEYEAGCARATDDGEIASAAYRCIEIADCRGGALVRPVAHGNRALAVAKIGIHVRNERDLALLREGLHRLRERR